MRYTLEEFVFYGCIGVLGYVYVGYPLLVYIASILFSRDVAREHIEPTVTVLITAFNEEDALAAKLDNTLALSYPKEKLSILVASDGSTDRTDEIAREYADRGVRLYRQEGRVGKTMTQNNAVARVVGDIILFSDATTKYPSDVLSNIIPPFADEGVGCVAGRLIYTDDASTNVGTGARSYWNYETFLKTAESKACSLIGASGCLYAVRRDAYEPMYAEACSDFLICTALYRKGLRSVFEPSAVCYEATNDRANDEMRMRVRVISQTFTDLWRNRDMLNPFRSGFYAVQLVSHKVLRYAVPVLLIAIFFANVALIKNGLGFGVLLGLQVLFYAGAVAGWVLEKAGLRTTFFVLPLYFVLANVASAIAFYKFVRGERFAAWDPIRGSR